MKNRIMTLIFAGVIAASGAMAVSAEETAERAKGIKFATDSVYSANVYTGYVGGVELDTTVDTILSALENKNGVEIVRDKTLGASDEVQHGDKLTLKAEDGTVINALEIIFMGNADKNNKINLGDASAMLQKIAKWEREIDEVAADVDGNGAVNLSDVSTILKYIAKWDVEFVKVPTLPGKGSSRVSSVIQTFSTGERMNVNLRQGQDYAVKFSVGEGKYAKSVKANYPSWGDTKGSIRLSLYKWDTDYETTIANDPIYTEKYENFVDNAEIVFSFADTADKGVGEGEYLWRIHEGFDERLDPNNEDEPVGVGMWTYNTPTADVGVTVFFEGEALEPGTPAYGPEAYISLGD